MAEILVVDDNPGTEGSVAEILGLLGYAVRVANGHGEALSEMRRSLPQTVLVDIEMQAADGLHVARSVRQAYGRATRIVARTASSRRAVWRKVAEAGFDCVVGKDASPIQLALAIQGCAGAPDLRGVGRDRRGARRFAATRRRSADAARAAGAARPSAQR